MDIFTYVDDQITTYPNKELTINSSYQFNQYELLNTVAAYDNSKYISGEYDSLGRRKPFRNISRRLCNKQRSAEDIDTKDIQLTTTKPSHYARSLVMTVANRYWMKKVNFSKTLNKMTETRGKFGGLLVQKVMRDDGLVDIEVVDWLTTITDPVDIASGVKIKQLQFNAAELKTMAKSGWENIDEAILMAAEESDHEKNYRSNKTRENNKSNAATDYISVYVVSGVLPRTFLDEDADMFEYSEQTHIITLHKAESKGSKKEKEMSGVVLYQEENIEHPYKYLPYELVEGRSLGRGMVEISMEAQKRINEAVINEKNSLDLAGTVIIQEPSGNSTDTDNIITDYVDGDKMEYNKAPMSLLNLTPQSLGFHQSVIDSWKNNSDEQASVLESNTGATPASATFRGQALNNEEANSIFRLRREEMDIFLQELYRDWIIPNLKKLIKKEEFLRANLTADELERVQGDWTYNQARNVIDDRIFNGEYDELPAGEKWIQITNDLDKQKDLLLEEMKGGGWFKVPKDWLKDAEYELDIHITDEGRVKQVFVSNQIDLLNSYLANKEALTNDPNALRMFEGIQETLGQSPVKRLQPVESPVQPQTVPEAPVDVTANQE